MTGGWEVSVLRGTAGEFHGRDVVAGTGRQVWVMDVAGPAVVLGSTQSLDEVDPVVAAERGLEVIRRRSGGGAVLVEPGGTVWVDVVVPPEDPRWDLDVGRAAHRLGGAWAEALTALGVADAVAHTGPLVTTPWSRRICFAGLGPGEVTVAGRKVVGLAQRRTRHGARFQTAALLRWDPDAVLAPLRLDTAERQAARHDIADRAAGVSLPAADVIEALLTSLRTR